MFAIGNDELKRKPLLTDIIKCKICGKAHKIEYGKDENGKESKLLAFFKCGDKTYLAGIDGKDIRR